MIMMKMHTLAYLLILFLISNTATSERINPPPISLPGCADRCGDISIPYPFGIGLNCSLNSSYNVLCNSTFNPPKPFLPTLSWNYTFYGLNRAVQIMRIDTTPMSLPSLTLPFLSLVIYSSTSGFTGRPLATNRSELIEFKNLDMRGTPFLLMPMVNTLVVVGCGGGVGIENSKNEIVIGCTTVCPDNTMKDTMTNSSCYGIGCCQTSVPTSLDYFELEFRSVQSNNSSSSLEFLSVVNNSDLANLSTDFTWPGSQNFSTILEWRLPILPRNVPNDSNAICRYDAVQASYYCYCKNEYYQGNPYLPQGCQVKEECEKCPDDCVLLDSGNEKYGCPAYLDAYHKRSVVPIALGLGISIGSISISAILYGFFRFLKRRKEARQKKSNFKKNGGLLLQQQMFSGEGAFERTKLFTCDELERATDNFNENRILGRGGQGTVYKGMLLDGTIVAVKKSKKVNESQLGQFINEVVILSQVVHRNVVKLFGCCLETEVPLLVYEFVPNGTLFQHIHNPREDLIMTWKMRLKIAVELAEALAYLHSSSSMPIYHRDIKTSNILLDDRYRTKVSDFGISRAVSVDQTHLTTCVKGTFGYIDPEYFQSNQFTEKSDVYSFGIVLLELLTSKKPVYVDESTESGSLASEFLLCMEECRLFSIVDADVLEVARVEEIEGVADLAKRCLSLNGNKRPTMKAVAMTLQMLNSRNGDPHLSLEQIVLEIGQVCFQDEGTLNILASATNSDDSSIYTQPLLFDTDSTM